MSITVIVIFLLFVGFANTLVVAEANAASTDGESAVMSSGCRISLSDPFKGRLEIDPTGSHEEQHAFYSSDFPGERARKHLHIIFGCKIGNDAQDAERICKESAGLILNEERWSPVHPTAQNQLLKNHTANTVSINLDKSDARGGLYVSSDTDGPMRYRLRTLEFCLISRSATLWGGAVVDRAPYSARHSTEKEAIRLIKSIDFAGSGR